MSSTLTAPTSPKYRMCGFPIPFWTLLIMIVILGAVVFKLRSWFKDGSPLLEELRDSGNDFVLFVVICLAMVFAAGTVAQTIHEHNDKISAFFDSVHEKCEPEPDTRTTEEFIDEELKKITQP